MGKLKVRYDNYWDCYYIYDGNDRLTGLDFGFKTKKEAKKAVKIIRLLAEAGIDNEN